MSALENKAAGPVWRSRSGKDGRTNPQITVRAKLQREAIANCLAKKLLDLSSVLWD